jgi:sterol desaturase/sphingolipid hydroxylase (fatty acid hydroxylase superfamily)
VLLTMQSVYGLAVTVAILASVFWAIELRWPGSPGQRRLRKGWRTDAWYLIFTPLITHTVGRVVVAAGIVLVSFLIGAPLNSAWWIQGWGLASQLPLLYQAILALILGDFIGYWTHRWLHHGMWPVHAIHHSSEEMDWMSTLRLHPFNDFLGRLTKAVPFLALGFSPLILAALLPFLAVHAFLLHANVDWSFGPLRHVLTSPVYHRWHHSSHAESCGKNFAGLFPVWDLLFGTHYMPRTLRPHLFGAPGSAVPDAFWGQVLYPLRTARVRERVSRP